MCLCILYTTFLSGQLYLAKIASYVSTAPSVTSIMAWLHSLPLPVSLNWKEKETERELTEMNSTASYNLEKKKLKYNPSYTFIVLIGK